MRTRRVLVGSQGNMAFTADHAPARTALLLLQGVVCSQPAVSRFNQICPPEQQQHVKYNLRRHMTFLEPYLRV